MSISSSPFPKAILYTYERSLWSTVPRLALIEKGYSKDDLEMREVDLAAGENFSPAILRVNSKGTLPVLVVPLAETTGTEVDTKFRALTESKAIVEFLDSSRSQQLLDIKGEENSKPAPVLQPATIEGKALCDSLIDLVHSTIAPFLLLTARSEQELDAQRKGRQGEFCRNRGEDANSHDALLKFKAEAQASMGGENPRTAAMNENLIKWYDEKYQKMKHIFDAYLTPTPDGVSAFLADSVAQWTQVITILGKIETTIAGPYALGDQISLADLHLTVWLARVFTSAMRFEPDSSQDQIAALEKCVRHPFLAAVVTDPSRPIVGPKTRQYWETLKSRPAFAEVYANGLH